MFVFWFTGCDKRCVFPPGSTSKQSRAIVGFSGKWFKSVKDKIYLTVTCENKLKVAEGKEPKEAFKGQEKKIEDKLAVIREAIKDKPKGEPDDCADLNNIFPKEVIEDLCKAD